MNTSSGGALHHKSPSSAPTSNDRRRLRQWLDDDYPAIASRAMQEQAESPWGDETGMRNDSQHGRSYAPRGHTPVIRLSAKRASTNMISTVTNQGKVRFMIYSGSMNAARLIQFFKQLLKGAQKKIVLILDNRRVQHAKPVKAWLAESRNPKRLEVFFLPAYSPALNPDEYLKGALKIGGLPSLRPGTPPRSSNMFGGTCACCNSHQPE